MYLVLKNWHKILSILSLFKYQSWKNSTCKNRCGKDFNFGMDCTKIKDNIIDDIWKYIKKLMFFLYIQRIKYWLYKDSSSQNCDGHSRSVTLLKHERNKKLMMRFWTNTIENGWICPSVVTSATYAYQQNLFNQIYLELNKYIITVNYLCEKS